MKKRCFRKLTSRLVTPETSVIVGNVPGFVAYYRVSTDRQGISGLGLDAQREAVSRYVAVHPLLAEFQEIESGKSHTNRPQLIAAMELCRKQKATLVIAKLDRLARDVHFISGLMKSGVEFVAVDMPHANRLTVHILAAVAEHEREMISARTKVALAEVKKRGVKLGNPRWEKTLHVARAARNPLSPSPQVVQIVQQQRQQGHTLRVIADHLHGLGIMTPYGNRWHAKTIRDLLIRKR